MLGWLAADEVGFGEGSDDPGVLECRPVTQAWSESAVTWNNGWRAGAAAAWTCAGTGWRT